MTDIGDAAAGLLRRRRANAAGGRDASHRVRVTAEESAILTELANAQGVTVPRLLVESALAGDRETASRRRDAIVELFAVRRLLAAVSNNLNQVARHANATSELPADAGAVVAAIARVVQRMDLAAEALAAPELAHRITRVASPSAERDVSPGATGDSSSNGDAPGAGDCP